MSTLIADLREPLRVLLGDRDASFHVYEDSALDAGVRTAVRMGLVDGYELTGDALCVSPAFASPNDYALLLYETVRLFVQSNPDGESYRTRAVSESVRGYARFLNEIQYSIHLIKNGTMFTSWQNFATWSVGLCGADLWGLLTDIEVQRPVNTITVGMDASG